IKEICAPEVRVPQLCPLQVSGPKDCFRQMRPKVTRYRWDAKPALRVTLDILQVGALEIRTVKMRRRDIGSFEISAVKICTLEVGRMQICRLHEGIGESNALQSNSR